LLISGEHERDLAAYFGEREYRELAILAKQAASVPPADEPVTVFVVPGIMGSQLGLKRQAPLPHDILWLDPIDIGVGRLASLRLSSGDPIVPLGVVLYSYLRLKLHLRASAFAPVLYDYDWRLGIDELGAAFARVIRGEDAKRVMIVAHSMGGLVSRAAMLQPGMHKVERLVLLGTPNFGSFAPLQALRGTYAVVRKIASLTGSGSPESLAAEIFNCFPSLYQMLPVGPCNGGLDLFDADEWPRSGPQPQVELLRDARQIQAKLLPPDARTLAVVGVGQETVTGVARRNDDFIYTITRRGDGTVPAVSAELPGARNHYAPVAHSDLTRDPLVAAAVTELLRQGTTRLLPGKWKSSSAAEARVSDRRLRRMHTEKVDWAKLEPDERRVFLENLNEPPKLRLRVPGRKAKSEVTLTNGSARRKTKKKVRDVASSGKPPHGAKGRTTASRSKTGGRKSRLGRRR
jgi:pimeloyl-ACP methyl ester carboxylesterase